MEAYLPFVAAVIVAAITAYANYRLGNLKTKVDSKTLVNDANEALRDDILVLVDKYEAREKQYEQREAKLTATLERREEQNDAMQELISQLRIEVNQLRIENQSLKIELRNVRTELEKFERKVFYRPAQGEKPE